MVIGLIGLVCPHTLLLGKVSAKLKVQRSAKRKAGLIKKDKDGNNTLHKAVMAKDSLAAIKTWVENDVDADVDSKNNDGYTPLYQAVDRKREDLVEYFSIDLKAKLNMQDNDGKTPFILAVEKGSPAMVRLFLARGASQKAMIDGEAVSALTVAAGRFAHGASHDEKELNENLSIIKLLLKYGADKNYTYYEGMHRLDVNAVYLLKFTTTIPDAAQQTPQFKEALKLLTP